MKRKKSAKTKTEDAIAFSTRYATLWEASMLQTSIPMRHVSLLRNESKSSVSERAQLELSDVPV